MWHLVLLLEGSEDNPHCAILSSLNVQKEVIKAIAVDLQLSIGKLLRRKLQKLFSPNFYSKVFQKKMRNTKAGNEGGSLSS